MRYRIEGTMEDGYTITYVTFTDDRSEIETLVQDALATWGTYLASVYVGDLLSSWTRVDGTFLQVDYREWE